MPLPFKKRSHWTIIIAAGWLAGIAFNVLPAARADDPPAVSRTDRDALRTKLAEIQKLLTELNTTIADSGKEIDSLTNSDLARGKIDSLQAAVANVLGAVSDNGAVATLAARVLAFEKDKLVQVQNSHFPLENKQVLIQGWQKLLADTEKATAELADARGQLAQLLKTIQQRSDYLSELAQLDDGDRMLQVIRELTKNLRQTSDSLKELAAKIVPPGT